MLEWIYFFLRGDWGSLWPKGGAMSHYPTRAITQNDYITLYVRDPMAAPDPRPCVNHSPTPPCDSLTLPAPITLRPAAMWPQNSGIPAPTSPPPSNSM